MSSTNKLKFQSKQEDSEIQPLFIDQLDKKEIIHPIQLHVKTIIIVGCTHAGTLAAITLRSLDKDCRIVVFEKNPVISFLSCGIHLAVNKTCTDQSKMFYNSPQTLRKMNIEVYCESQVENVDYASHIVNSSIQEEKIQFKFDKLIISSGSSPMIPPIIQNVNYKNSVENQIRGMKRILLAKNYADSLKLAKLIKPQRICIIGAGLIGMELAGAFVDVGSHVTVIDHGERMLNKYFDEEYTNILTELSQNLKLLMLCNARVSRMAESLTEVIVLAEQKVGKLIKNIQLTFDYVVLCSGLKANTKFAQTPELNSQMDVIITDKLCHTSIADVYAIGDCASTYSHVLQTNTYNPLATHAMRHGLIAAYDISGLQLPYAGTNGTCALQIFNYSMATTGLLVQDAQRKFPNIQRVIHSDYLYHHYCHKKIERVVQKEVLSKCFNIHGDIVRRLADQIVDSYELEAETQDDQIVSVSICYSAQTGKIFGAQAMGKQDITQAVNALSIAVSLDVLLDEIAQMDLGGQCGEEKPWNVLAVTAASRDLEIVDFEPQEDEDLDLDMGPESSEFEL